MTLDEFFEQLRDETLDGTTWLVDAQGAIRSGKRRCCPIELFAGDDFLDALDEGVRVLGLSEDDAEDIVDAADLPEHYLRARLLDACGLSPAQDFARDFGRAAVGGEQ